VSTLKNLVEGKPLRSPLHPALVHPPIALFPASVLFDLASWLVNGSGAAHSLVGGAFVCIVGGLVTGLFAAVFGMIDYSDIRADHPAKKTAAVHMVLNVVALVLYGVSAAMRYGALTADKTAALPFGISVTALVILSYSGYLGGHLVYSDGIAVGRHRRRTDTPKATIETPLANKLREIEVAEDNAVGEGATLRVKIETVVMTIARVEGALYAFQEFCTHRYGPLSEGALCGSEVVSPWHNSRFDVRNGRVTGGPAKVDLRTFRVTSRDGKIWVEVPEGEGKGRGG